jgi:hypothetical protein
MKTQSDINSVLSKVDIEGTKFPGMTYEDGIEEALLWVLEEIPDDEFEYAPESK